MKLSILQIKSLSSALFWGLYAALSDIFVSMTTCQSHLHRSSSPFLGLGLQYFPYFETCATGNYVYFTKVFFFVIRHVILQKQM
jgi:hypothetical protein